MLNFSFVFEQKALYKAFRGKKGRKGFPINIATHKTKCDLNAHAGNQLKDMKKVAANKVKIH